MKRVLGWLDDGSAIFERETRDLETFSFLPAQPGWCTLQWYRGDDRELHTCKTAIVAWKICTMSGVTHGGEPFVSTWTTPVVADSTDVDKLDYAVLGPDGLVYVYEQEPQPFGAWLEAKNQQTAHEHPVE
jgi:hypothetical protein